MYIFDGEYNVSWRNQNSILEREGTIDFSSEITIPPNFTAERAENAERLEKPSGIWNTLNLCALCDLRVDKSLVFSIVPAGGVKRFYFDFMCFDI